MFFRNRRQSALSYSHGYSDGTLAKDTRATPRLGPLGVKLFGAGLLALGIGPAAAATATGSMTVTATVAATCVIAAAPLAFGNYSGLQSDATAVLSITCTNTTPYTIGLGVGLGTGATVTSRKMTLTTATLGYALYSDTGRTINWGLTPGTDTVAGTGSGAVQPITVYGRVPAGEFVAPGAYTDTVVATVTY